MSYGRYNWSYFTLRVGLGLVFLWIGIDIFRSPENWLGFVPATLPLGLDRELALSLNGVLDIVLGVLFLSNQLIHVAAFLAVLHLLGILVTQGVNAIIIRDVGLLGASISLLLWPTTHRHHWFRIKLPWRHRHEEAL